MYNIKYIFIKPFYLLFSPSKCKDILQSFTIHSVRFCRFKMVAFIKTKIGACASMARIVTEGWMGNRRNLSYGRKRNLPTSQRYPAQKT